MRKVFFTIIFVLTFGGFVSGQNSDCPAISIIGPAAVPQEKEPVTFTVIVDKKAEDLRPEYVWSVSDGKITEGQGTAVITVEPGQNGSPTVTIEIKGLPEGCKNTESESISCGLRSPEAENIGEIIFFDSKIDSEKFDKIITALRDDSSAQVYVLIYNNEKTPTAKIEQKEKQIREIIREKNIPPDRIVIARGGEKEDLIRFWLIPAGASPPNP